MSATYSVDWASGNLEGIPGKAPLSIAQKTQDSASTSLTLTGKGLANYGEIQQENFIRLLENFASATMPTAPTVGQLWYKADESILYVCVDVAKMNASQSHYFSDGTIAWAQAWPSVQVFAGLNEYNALATALNRVVGAPSVYGSDPDVALNQYGWGQTDLAPIYTNASTLAAGFSPSVYPATFDNNAWAILLSRARKAIRHIGVAGLTETSVSPVGFISDGRPMVGDTGLAHDYNDYPAQGSLADIEFGWGGFGYPSVNVYYMNTVAAVAAIASNRFSATNITSTSPVTVDITRPSSWTSDIVHVMDMTFANEDEAKAFFNAGGFFKMVWSHADTSDAINAAWNSFLATETDLILDFKGLRRGAVYQNAPSLSTSIGFYDLTGTYQTLYVHDRVTGSFTSITDGGIIIEAMRSAAGAAHVVTIKITFAEVADVGEVLAAASTRSKLEFHYPDGSNMNSPAIAAPMAISSGSFTF